MKSPFSHLWLEASGRKPRGWRGGRAPGAPASHVTDREARVVQVHGAAVAFLRAVFTRRLWQGFSSHFGSWVSCRDSLDLEVPWLDLGKRLAKSSLLQGTAGDQRVAASGWGA